MPLGRLSVEKAFSPEERQDAYALLMAAAHVGGANGGAAWASSCGSCRCGGAWCCGVGGALNSGCGGGGTYPCAGYHSGGGAANATVAVSPHMPAQNSAHSYSAWRRTARPPPYQQPPLPSLPELLNLE